MFPWRLSAHDLAAGDDRPCAGAPLTDRCAAELVMAVLYNAARFLFSLPLPTTSTAASQVVWVHLQLVTVLGLARDQGTSLLSALCRAAPLQVRAGQRTIVNKTFASVSGRALDGYLHAAPPSPAAGAVTWLST